MLKGQCSHRGVVKSSVRAVCSWRIEKTLVVVNMINVSHHGGVTSGGYPIIAKRNETTTVVCMIVIPIAERSNLNIVSAESIEKI